MLTKSFSIKGGPLTIKMDVFKASHSSLSHYTIEVLLDNPIISEEVGDVKVTAPTIAGGQILELTADIPKYFCC